MNIYIRKIGFFLRGQLVEGKDKKIRRFSKLDVNIICKKYVLQADKNLIYNKLMKGRGVREIASIHKE